MTATLITLLLSILPTFALGMQGGGGNNPLQGVPLQGQPLQGVPVQGQPVAPGHVVYTTAMMNELARNRLRAFLQSDGCNCVDNPAYSSDRFTSQATRACRKAMTDFKVLPQSERVLCPGIRRPGCRKCNKAVKRCGFMCNPTQAEIQHAYRNGVDPQSGICKQLKDIVGHLIRQT